MRLRAHQCECNACTTASVPSTLHPTVGAVRRKSYVEQEKQKADHRSACELGRRSLVHEHDLVKQFQRVSTSRPDIGSLTWCACCTKVRRSLPPPRCACTSVVMRIFRPISTDSHHLFAKRQSAMCASASQEATLWTAGSSMAPNVPVFDTVRQEDESQAIN